MNQKGFSPVILIVAIVAILGLIGGVYYWRIQRNQNDNTVPLEEIQNKVNNNVTKPTTSLLTTNIESDEVKDWKTYTDPILNFSIKYPDDIVILRSPTETLIEGGIMSEGGVEFARAIDAKKDFRIITTLDVLFRGKSGTLPEQALQGECPTKQGELCQEKFEQVMINNAKGIKTLGPSYPDHDNYYLTNKNAKGEVVRLLISDKTDDTSNLETFQKMVKTFRFLD